MAVWPDIASPNGLSETPTKSQVRSEFENGAVQSRPRYSRGRDKWSLSWQAIPEADYQTLKTFFYANQGVTFSWVHPIEGTTYTVRFTEDQLGQAAYVPVNRRSLTVVIEEA